MKLLLVVVALSVMSIFSFGQTTVAAFHHAHRPNNDFTSADQLLFQNDARPRGLRQRNIGRALAIGGSILGFSGVLLFTDARKGEVIYGGQVTQTAEVGKMTAGIMMIEAGIGMLIPGIILWKKGQKKYNRYLEQQNVSVNTSGSQIYVRYSF